jgi:hypothetical protein
MARLPHNMRNICRFKSEFGIEGSFNSNNETCQKIAYFDVVLSVRL